MRATSHPEMQSKCDKRMLACPDEKYEARICAWSPVSYSDFLFSHGIAAAGDEEVPPCLSSGLHSEICDESLRFEASEFGRLWFVVSLLAARASRLLSLEWLGLLSSPSGRAKSLSGCC
eukprot:scaffold97561_cov37-Prasinocladus_malaysianus.AAC.1